MCIIIPLKAFISLTSFKYFTSLFPSLKSLRKFLKLNFKWSRLAGGGVCGMGDTGVEQDDLGVGEGRDLGSTFSLVQGSKASTLMLEFGKL